MKKKSNHSGKASACAHGYGATEGKSKKQKPKMKSKPANGFDDKAVLSHSPNPRISELTALFLPGHFQ